MHLKISKEAAYLYKKEIPLQAGDSLRLFVRVGGVGSGGFSVGVTKEEPPSKCFKVIKENIIFFVTEDDYWYFDGMEINYHEDLDYVQFKHSSFDHLDHPEQVKMTK
ncbi:iron-sulfur cluster biosynthesis family protein [Halalkalibacter sp. APA_J-10(15)]|uniref:iron-sulfur cluster biosynthesis family protein n=1 Tax=Halalkalibacter sp. APA_J-10(15) TaxID=2933805 RepID=UPI001FF10A88|nr:iron-sulfur cluster biosynthesis family protein [Halalkalibacter sp. APA_J-10(15)]MCK0473948.1 hypothetical protein [Halalkalibacter sp. APA_J-10(15)]